MISLSVITWRLGNLQSEQFEYLLDKLEKRDQTKLDLDEAYNDIFFLQSCQRVIIATSTARSKIRQFYHTWSEANELDLVELAEPEWFYGDDALYHLSEVVSALDSAVIGEEQIQGQFRAAYLDAEDDLSPYLQGILQKVLRTGKRVRKRSLLEPGQISTISVVTQFISDEIDNAHSIGVIGTGKMAKGIIRYFREHIDKDVEMKIYTTTHDRAGQVVSDKQIEYYNSIDQHDIIFTATAQSGLITDSFLDEHNLESSVIVDLGMPRNCRVENQSVNLFTMEEVIRNSREENQNEILSSAYFVLDDELEQIKIELMKQQHAETIKQLRMDMLTAAQSEKKDLVKKGSNEEKTFDQMVNKLIHISQQHLEKHILMENKS